MNDTNKKVWAIRDEYLKTFFDFIRNKAFVIAILLVIGLGYGFTLTNTSIGVDDLEFDKYLNGIGFAEGRFSGYLINKIFGIYVFAPFWQDFLSLIVFFVAVVFWCVLIKKVIGNSVGMPAYIAFAAVFISYPAINELFIYMGASFSIGLGFLLTGFSLAICYEVFYNGLKIKWLLAVILLMCFTISLYESFALVFVCGMCLLQILRLLFIVREKQTFKYHLIIFIKYSCLLAIGIAMKYLIAFIIMRVFSIAPVDYAKTQITWGQGSIIEQLRRFAGSIKSIYFVGFTKYLYAALFDIASFLLAIVGIVLAVKKKDGNIFLLFCAVILSTFLLTILQGVATPMRANQSQYLLVAFTVWILCAYAKKWRRPVVLFASACLVLYQTRDLSLWFYNDYLRYQQDKQTAIAIGTEIDKLDATKPVVFIGIPATYYYPNLKHNNTNGISFITWSLTAFNSDTEIYKFFNSCGFPITEGNSEQKAEAKDAAASMPSWPKAGSVEGYKDIIIVNFGK